MVGRTIRINQHELTIVGVAARAVSRSMPVTSFDLWVPYMEQPVLNGVQLWMLRDRHDRNMLGIARVRRGVTMEQARQELKALADRMAIANADVSRGHERDAAAAVEVAARAAGIAGGSADAS